MHSSGSFLRRRLAASALTLGLLCQALLATAQDAGVSAEEQRARALVDGFLDSLSQQLNLQMQSGLLNGFTIDRDYQLTGADGRYTAAFDQAAFTMEQFSVDLAPLQLMIEPRDDGTSAVGMQLPETIEATSEGQTVAELTFAGQDIVGVWSETINNLQSLDMRLQGMRMTFADPMAPTVEIAALAMDHDLDIAADQSWRQNSVVTLNGLSISATDGVFTASRGGYDVVISGQDYSALRRQAEQMSALGQTTGSQEDLSQAVTEFLKTVFDVNLDYRSNFVLDDVGFARDGQTMGRAGRVGFGVDGGVSDGQAQFGYRVDVSGIDVPMIPLPPPLVPQNMRFSVALSGINRTLIENLVALAQQTEGMDEDQAKLMMQMQLPAVLMASPLKLEFTDSYVTANAAAVNFSANVATSPDSMLGGVGSVLLVVRGLPAIVEMTGLEANPGAAQTIAMFTAFSQRSEQDGQIVDTFDLQLTPEGKIMLNGKDISALMGMGPPPQ